jgi:uncharacterized coiled-coil DUF342 family protein
MFDWLRRILKVDQETIEETWEYYDDTLEHVYDEIEKLRGEINELHLKLADIDDKVYPVVKKLSTRAAVRDSREKAEDLNTSKRGGIMKYGSPLKN